jgi:protein ImuB
MARGDETRPLIPSVAAERFTSAMELEWPIEGAEPLSFVLTRLLEPLSTQLERRDRGAAALHVHLRLVTREVHARRLLLPSPLRDVRTLRTLALLDLESNPPAAAIDQVTVTIDPTPARVLQHTLFSRAVPTPEQLATLLARLNALVGADRVGAAETIDSYRPGAFTMTPLATEHEEPQSEHRQDPHSSRRTGPPRGPVRGPVRGWPPSQAAAGRTEPTAAVAPAVVSSLRRCRQPVPARVAVDAADRPVRVTTDRRGFAGGSVVQCAGPWRSSGDWWDVGGGPGGGRRAADGGWNRDEWDVALSDGAVYRIFRDRVSEGWFVDAIVD